ncbi:MAG: BMP family ABC transporter substrate-binding protein [Spirochaeta sp. LUC14_002_19_P3]|nr:MAG: BMP family ABC transporter substrate-binding protein [Spirochaeta sp. LUC14_002_19_P3]
MRLSVRVFILGCMAPLLIFIGGCVKKKSDSADLTRVAYIINGALGDQSFYDSGQQGIDRLARDFEAVSTTIETNFDSAKYPQALQSAVQWNAGVIFVISYGFEDLVKEYADKYEDIIFVNIDTVVENSRKTITSVDFIEEEGAFMAGAAAGMATLNTAIPGINEEKLIGAVGGDKDPVIDAFIFGYEQGARYIDKDIAIERIYAGTWEDPVRGKQAARQLFSQGCDVVFQIASLTGSGVLEAAAEEGLYAIGVDSNQNGMQPGSVITSDLKNIGNAIYKVYSAIRDGTFKTGEVLEYGLAEKGVGLAIDDYTRAILPAQDIDRLLKIESDIISGAITVEKFQ